MRLRAPRHGFCLLPVVHCLVGKLITLHTLASMANVRRAPMTVDPVTGKCVACCLRALPDPPGLTGRLQLLLLATARDYSLLLAAGLVCPWCAHVYVVMVCCLCRRVAACPRAARQAHVRMHADRGEVPARSPRRRTRGQCRCVPLPLPPTVARCDGDSAQLVLCCAGGGTTLTT